ncbi:MAG: hypothetical protein IPM26_03705 [Saprospiraceae bacterium]|nr:hypothetical protein [Saprospiraceae bacterium]
MKNLLFFVFLNVILTNVNLKAQCGFKNIEIDSCCITVEVLENEYPRWSVKIDTLTTIWSMDLDSNRFTYCFDTKDSFELELIYYNEFGFPGCGASQWVNIDEICVIDTPCIQYLCWEMLGGCCELDTIKAFEIEVNGVPITIPIGPQYVAGAYNWLASTMVSILESYSYGGILESESEFTDPCLKGDLTPIPGFYFYNSSVRINAISGVVNCAGPGDPPEWKDTKVNFQQFPEGCFE